MPQKVFTLDELSQYDGSDDAKPIYIAIMYANPIHRQLLKCNSQLGGRYLTSPVLLLIMERFGSELCPQRPPHHARTQLSL